jgi:hypothetical protein
MLSVVTSLVAGSWLERVAVKLGGTGGQRQRGHEQPQGAERLQPQKAELLREPDLVPTVEVAHVVDQGISTN